MIRVAIIGYGLAGRVFHGPLLGADPSYSVRGIVTANPERAAAAASRHPDARILSGPGQVLSGDFDLAVVAAPTPSHVELATLTVGAGLPTVVDKPLAVRAADAEALITLAERGGVPLTVFQNRRWDGDFLTVRRLVTEGLLGDVWRFESRFEWLSARPRPAWKIGTAGRDGGGVAYDLGAHLVDQAIQLFGPVKEVYGELDRHRENAVNDDDSFIALTHESGVRSHLGMSSLVAQRGFRFRVLGSASAYGKWGLDPQESQLASGMSPLDDGFGVEPARAHGILGRDGEGSPLPTERGAYRAFYARLAEALTGGGPVPVDPRDALAAIRVIEDLHG
ncbi:Gfo/Idh/MocA family oxidoreductase [Nonomuraea sp. K274]|uniref:Gfo/Idh/MocA family oxidoreductase n=1 Tax=Nonomuraea cypriaca TaxID=1187855 RepID=A0A931AHG0_9ACTN|nr:Gfo/Idh/MocA family oxidoreductase [Nonomuraea cypriaca]MBF8190364.1 Gfo/Idh/MocA family oxidoreductase [Nonomuraea cypriaca]